MCGFWEFEKMYDFRVYHKFTIRGKGGKCMVMVIVFWLFRVMMNRECKWWLWL
ncbi:hypothetical protein Hanom_Chr11g00993601 [Helianthus anomalus]